MKKIIYSIILSAFFVIGCQEDISILEPQSDVSIEQLPKGRPILGRDLDDDLFFWDDSSSAQKNDGFFLYKDGTSTEDEIDQEQNYSKDRIINANRYGWTRTGG